MLGRLTGSSPARLVDAMTASKPCSSESTPSYILRDLQPGDRRWVVRSRRCCYTRGCGWTSEFEALVAEIVAKYLRDYDLSAERCWIGEGRQGGGFGVRRAA